MHFIYRSSDPARTSQKAASRFTHSDLVPVRIPQWAFAEELDGRSALRIVHGPALSGIDRLLGEDGSLKVSLNLSAQL